MADEALNPSERIGKGAGRPRKRDGKPTGGRKARGEKLAEVEAENAALRERLKMNEPMTMSVWERSGTPQTRSQMAARAYMQEWGDPRRALILLGFTNTDASEDDIQDHVSSSRPMCWQSSMIFSSR